MDASVHKVKLFKSCRRQYELKYIENLEPVVSADALETGKKYHSYIDAYYKQEPIEPDITKEYALFEAFKQYIAPKLNIVGSECKMVCKISENHKLHGIVDGMEKECFVEHKTTGETDLEKYEYMLGWDEQILAYMLLTGFRTVKYTVIRKPNIRLSKNETEEDFFKRMIAWYKDDTDNKCRVLTITRTDEEVEEYRKSLVAVLDEMEKAEENKLFYRNTCACNLYNRMCDYASVCMHYDPDTPNVNFSKREAIDFSNAEERNTNNGTNKDW